MNPLWTHETSSWRQNRNKRRTIYINIILGCQRFSRKTTFRQSYKTLFLFFADTTGNKLEHFFVKNFQASLMFVGKWSMLWCLLSKDNVLALLPNIRLEHGENTLAYFDEDERKKSL